MAMSRLIALALTVLLTPRAAEAAAHWRSFGKNSRCNAAATAKAGSGDAAQLHSGVESLEVCKALCQAATGCHGVEFSGAKGECTVLREAIAHAQIAAEAGTECLLLQDSTDLSREVFVMLPLSVVSNSGTIGDPETLLSQFEAMQSAGIDGFMVDFWWGITEPAPKAYNFAPYRQLVDMAKARAWKVQAVSSFHRCGGNVGDNCNITLPSFVHDLEGIWYKDAEGHINKEYISLFADEVEVYKGRTPVQMYSDWFTAFKAEFSAELGGTISEVMVGMGPCGELRYPAYQLKHWNFCGIGEFQCYDDHALSSLAKKAEEAGNVAWALPPLPAQVGTYNSRPSETKFFTKGYQTEAGKFFLDWYSSSLEAHGARVLSAAKDVFQGSLRISGKVAGIHWWYGDASHAAEVTAGYYNTNSRDAYRQIADMFAKYDASLDFTCLEMRNTEQPSKCMTNPEWLVNQAISAAEGAGIPFGGENALARFDDWAYDQMLSYKERLHGITYLRLSPRLVKPANLARFASFVGKMHGDSGNGQRRLTVTVAPESGRESRAEFMV